MLSGPRHFWTSITEQSHLNIDFLTQANLDVC